MKQKRRTNIFLMRIVKFFTKIILCFIPQKIAQDLSMFFTGWYGIWLRYEVYKKIFKKIGNNVNIKEGVILRYPQNIEIGDNVSINEFCYLNGPGGIKIGNNVSLAVGVKLISFNHCFDDSSKPIWKQKLKLGKIEIEEDVWMGADVIVLKNVKIGKGCVIGAGSVVTKNIPKNSVAVGNPAKIIKKRN